MDTFPGADYEPFDILLKWFWRDWRRGEDAEEHAMQLEREWNGEQIKEENGSDKPDQVQKPD